MLEKKDPWNSQTARAEIPLTSAVSDKPAESKWVIDIKNKLKPKLELARADADAGPGAWEKLSIYRIPKRLRKSDEKDEKAYTPQMVSLGPYHHGESGLSGMERHKWRALHQVLTRTGHRIERYLEAVKEIEEKARACYEGPLEMSSDDFVEMLLLDSTFILEIFRGYNQGFESLGYSDSDPVFAWRTGMTSIRRDMIMLENQIPLFVLNKIHAIQHGVAKTSIQRDMITLESFLDLIHTIQHPGCPRISVASLALRFFRPLAPTSKALAMLVDQSGLHCLEVFRRCLLAVHEEPEPTPSPGCIKKWFLPRVPGCIKKWKWFYRRVPGCIRKWKLFHPRVPGCIKKWFHPRDKNRQPTIHCVTELKEAGIKFKMRKTDRFCDIDFNNGVLEIPRLLVHDSTKSLFLNLIAFEQCHQNCTNDITSYAVFMDNLINDPADVAYLHHCRIVDSYLGSNVEVSDLFNCFCHEVAFDIDNSWLSELTENINRYYYQPWNAWRASLTHSYFNNPWSIISFIAATVLVLLTLAQTFYAVYAYYMPPS